MIGQFYQAMLALLLSALITSATAQTITLQPSPPVANSPFVAYVPVDSPFTVNAGFDTTSLQVEGNTLSVRFLVCNTCPQAPQTGPFLLPVPALQPGNYTLLVFIPGFSPQLPPQSFSFSVAATAGARVSLPALSTWSFIGLLAGCIFIALLALRRGIPYRNRGRHG